MHKYFMLLELNLQDKFMEVSLLGQNMNMYLITFFINKCFQNFAPICISISLFSCSLTNSMACDF